MSIELIGGLILAALAAIGAAFGIGHSRGTTKAEQKATEEKSAATVAAAEAAAERQTTVAKEAANVDQSVNNLSNDDVDRELRKYTRKG